MDARICQLFSIFFCAQLGAIRGEATTFDSVPFDGDPREAPERKSISDSKRQRKWMIT